MIPRCSQFLRYHGVFAESNSLKRLDAFLLSIRRLSLLISHFPLHNDIETAHKTGNGWPAEGLQRRPMGFQSHHKGQHCANSRRRTETRSEHMWRPTGLERAYRGEETETQRRQKDLTKVCGGQCQIIAANGHCCFRGMTRDTDFERRWDAKIFHTNTSQKTPVKNACPHLDQQEAAF